MFTNDWFSSNISVWQEKVLPKLNGITEPRYLEIGVHEGRSLCWMLENFPNLKATAIDPLNIEGQYEAFMENVGDRVKLWRVKSAWILHDLYGKGRKYDLIYIDGSHWAKDVLFDTVLAWPMLNNGGVMVWDDYGWIMEEEEIKRPKPAIDAFLICYRTEYRVLHIGYQFIVEKVPATLFHQGNVYGL